MRAPAERFFAPCALVVVTFFAGCRAHRQAPSYAGPPPASWRVTALDVGELAGVSGLAVAGREQLWAVPERDRFILRLAPRPDGALGVAVRLPLAGVPQGTDTESLAVLGPRQLALGTETLEEGRARDAVYLVSLSEAGAEAAERIELDYGAWQMRANANEGIEGLCATPGQLWAGSESVGVADGRRFAPVARYELATGQWFAYRLWLTSASGKLSSLACRQKEASGVIELVVIERHFDVSRVLYVRLDAASAARDLEPEVALELAGHFAPLPNFEGVDWWGEDRLLIVSDNHTRGAVSGPTSVVLAPWPPTALER